MKVTVAGTGYVGLVSAAVFASMGHDVTGFDVDARKIELLRQGKVPFFENGIEDLIKENTARLSFTDDFKTAYRDAEIIFVAVPTPEDPDGSANLKYVSAAVEQIAQSVEHDAIVVIKSTVPMGTNAQVQLRFDELLEDSGRHIEVVSNPEFLSQGTAVHNMLHPDRVVVGVRTKAAEDIMRSFYASVDAPVMFMSLESAEMVKYASNDFLALKISYINEIANLCELLGADIEDVSKGMGADPRIGNKFLKAGIGYGGSCFPKDTKALHWLSYYKGRELKTVKAAIDVNTAQKTVLLDKALLRFGSLDGMKAAVLGLAFKPGTDDLREAPSIPNIDELLESGAAVQAWDPLAEENYKRLFPDQDIKYCASIGEALDGADICFIMTEWPEVLALSAQDFIDSMAAPVVYDGRNCFDPAAMHDAGVFYESIGR